MNKDVAGFFVVYDVAKFAITEDEDNSEKSGLGVFARWLEKGLLQYVNGKKITEWSETTRAQFPGSSTHSDELTIVCKLKPVKACLNKNVVCLVVYDVAKFVITGDEDNSEKSGLGFFENWLEKGLL